MFIVHGKLELDGTVKYSYI